MKATHLLLTGTVFFGLIACTEKKETIQESTTIEKDTIVVQEQNNQDPVIIENNTAKNEDGTSVSINKDGVEFSTKSGENSTEVEIKNKK